MGVTGQTLGVGSCTSKAHTNQNPASEDTPMKRGEAVSQAHGTALWGPTARFPHDIHDITTHAPALAPCAPPTLCSAAPALRAPAADLAVGLRLVRQQRAVPAPRVRLRQAAGQPVVGPEPDVGVEAQVRRLAQQRPHARVGVDHHHVPVLLQNLVRGGGGAIGASGGLAGLLGSCQCVCGIADTIRTRTCPQAVGFGHVRSHMRSPSRTRIPPRRLAVQPSALRVWLS